MLGNSSRLGLRTTSLVITAVIAAACDHPSICKLPGYAVKACIPGPNIMYQEVPQSSFDYVRMRYYPRATALLGVTVPTSPSDYWVVVDEGLDQTTKRETIYHEVWCHVLEAYEGRGLNFEHCPVLTPYGEPFSCGGSCENPGKY